MPTRLRREAARWGDSKLAELLIQAAEAMEAAERERQHVSLEGTACNNCHDPAHAFIEAQLAASRALVDKVRDYLTREAHPDWTDAGRVSMAHAALTPASPGGSGG